MGSHTLASVAHLVGRRGTKVQGFPTSLPPQDRSACASVTDPTPKPTKPKAGVIVRRPAKARRPLVPAEVVVGPAPARVLALDPSSTCTGWAEFVDGRFWNCGRFLPKRNRPANDRIAEILDEVDHELAAFRPDVVVIEDTSGKVSGRHGGAGAGLAVHGKAVGAVWQRCAASALVGRTVMVVENDWTRGVKKAVRTRRVALDFETLGYDAQTDPGGDVADAVGLGLYFLDQVSKHDQLQSLQQMPCRKARRSV